MSSLVDVLKKYVRNKTSLSKKQINALEQLLRSGATAVFNILGIGTCWALVQEIRKS